MPRWHRPRSPAPIRRAARGRFYCAGTLLGALFLLGATSRDSWVLYRGDGFSVRVPAAPRVQEDRIETPTGPQRVLILSSVLASESYAVVCTFYAKELVDRAGAERLLAAALLRFLDETEGSLIRQQPIALLGHPGHEVAFLSLDSERITTARIFFAGERLFSLIGDVPRESGPDAGVTRFFRSFELAPQPEPDAGDA